MIIKFKAFVAVKDGNGWKRIEESTHETEKEAQKVTDDFVKSTKKLQ